MALCPQLWGRDQIDEVIRSGQRLDVKLTQPVNVYWVYITAWATPDSSSSATTSTSARSTSFAMCLASPQT